MSYPSGRTASPKITFTMREVLNNIELKGTVVATRVISTIDVALFISGGTAMGSQRELTEATNFIAEHKIVPVVSEILGGLETFEKGFEAMKRGSQFGKIVIRMRTDQGRL